MRAPTRRVFRGNTAGFRPAVGRRGQRLPAAGVARDRAHPVRRDHQLRRACAPRGCGGIGPRRGRGHGTQSALGRRAVPPRRRKRRQPHRICRRARAQDAAARDRGRIGGVAHLRPADLARLVALAAMWGASYLFMRYAVPHFGAVALIEWRTLIAGLALGAFLLATGATVGWRRHWPDYLFVGAVGLALPFVLIAEALTTIDASTGAILNALSPLFASVVAAVWIRDPLTPAKMAGIAALLPRTAVVVGGTPQPMRSDRVLPAGRAVVASAVFCRTQLFTH